MILFFIIAGAILAVVIAVTRLVGRMEQLWLDGYQRGYGAGVECRYDALGSCVVKDHFELRA